MAVITLIRFTIHFVWLVNNMSSAILKLLIVIGKKAGYNILNLWTKPTSLLAIPAFPGHVQPAFYVSGKRPMADDVLTSCVLVSSVAMVLFM